MPSFQLYEVKQEFKLNDLVGSDLLDQVNLRKDDPQTLKKFIESSINNYRDLSFKPIQNLDATKMKFDEKIQFQDKQSLWVNDEKLVLKYKYLLLIGKSRRKMEKLLFTYLREAADSKPIYFNEKQLWNIWKNLSSNLNSDLELRLHRVIVKNTYIDAYKINELNLHSKNLDEFKILENIIKESDKVKAITIKIRGFYPSNKWMTIRIDKNGSLLVYGKHKPEFIIDFLKVFIQSI